MWPSPASPASPNLPSAVTWWLLTQIQKRFSPCGSGTREHGAPVRKGALLKALSAGGDPPRTLGEANARLLALHTRLFGRDLTLVSHCPACGGAAQFSADADVLAAQALPTHAVSLGHLLEAHGHAIELRLPDEADLAALGGLTDEDEFARHLLARCVVACTERARLWRCATCQRR